VHLPDEVIPLPLLNLNVPQSVVAVCDVIPPRNAGGPLVVGIQSNAHLALLRDEDR
jgi:hypothetical protein